MEEDVAAARHLCHQETAAVARREVRNHLVEPGRNAGAVAPVAAPGRLHDEEGWEAGAAQEPQRALVAFMLPLEDRPLHGAIMGARARRVHRTMVRCFFLSSRPVARPSKTDSLRLGQH